MTDALPTLETARLTLKPADQSYAPAIVDCVNDWEVVRWLSALPYPYALEDAQWFLNECQEGRYKSWFIFDDTGLVGCIGIDGTLGYWLRKSAWGNGYMSEAVDVVIAHHFAEPAQTELWSSYHPDNERSANVLRKAGFEVQGTKELSMRAAKMSVTAPLVRLTRESWEGK